MLEGDRVRLVAVRKEFIPTFASWMNDREILQHVLMYRPLTLEEEERWHERMAELENVIFFSLLVKHPLDDPHCEGEKLIGNLSISLDHRNGVGNLGILIGEKDYWGQGYGSEALHLLLQYAFDTLNLQRVELEVFSSNLRAQKCYQKVGFREEGRRRRALYLRGTYIDALMYSILKEEYSAL